MPDLSTFRKRTPQWTRNRASVALVLVIASLGAIALLQTDKVGVSSDKLLSAAEVHRASVHGVDTSTQKATGIIEVVDHSKRTFVLHLGTSQSMGWPVLAKVGFAVHDAQLMEGLSIGSKVTIEFRRAGLDMQVIAITKNSGPSDISVGQ